MQLDVGRFFQNFRGCFQTPDAIFIVYEYLIISLLNCRKLLLKLPDFYLLIPIIPFKWILYDPKRDTHLLNYCNILAVSRGLG